MVELCSAFPHSTSAGKHIHRAPLGSQAALKHRTSSVAKPWCQVFHCARNHILCIKHELFKFLSTNLFLNLGIVRVGTVVVPAGICHQWWLPEGKARTGFYLSLIRFHWSSKVTAYLIDIACTRLCLLGHQTAPKSWHRDFVIVKNAWPSIGSFLASSFNLS